MSEFQVMAGNDLRSGRVIYLTANGWSDDWQAAIRLNSDIALENARVRAEQASQENHVIDPYLVQVIADGSQPTHIRERIRSSGPTCLPKADRLASQPIAV